MSMETIRFSQTDTYGYRLFMPEGETAEIIFENTATGLRKTIVDDQGMILRFPGVANPDVVSVYAKGFHSQTIRFLSCIRRLGEHYALIWQIQPDGRYWEDEDGFGRTPDDEIDLYARLDEKGDFIEPFRLYSVGSEKFFGTDKEERLADSLHTQIDPLTWLRQHVPEMLAEMSRLAEKAETGTVEYTIPGTLFQVRISLMTEMGKWFVHIGMSKRGSDTEWIGMLDFLPLEEQRTYLKSEEAKTEAGKRLINLFYTLRSKS